MAGEQEQVENSEDRVPAVLVVEGEIMIRLAVADGLRRRGYRVLGSSSGEDAQKIMNTRGNIALVFADINLGAGMNGLELARWIKITHPRTRIVFASGRYNSSAIDDLADAPLLEKPYSYDTAAAVVAQMLGSKLESDLEH